jgi:hypothetical protein
MDPTIEAPSATGPATNSASGVNGAPLRCHLAILREQDAEIVVTPEPGGFRLPALGIPGRQRMAPNLLPRIREFFDMAAVCRFELAGDGLGADERCVVLEAIPPQQQPPPGQVWLPLRGLEWADFETRSRDLLWRVLARLNAYATGRLPARFVRAGWLDEVRDWTTACLAPLGLELSGGWTQYNMGPNFSLLRFDTSGSPVWFKAVGHPREFDITLRLAALGIPHTPRTFASRSDWHGWLSFAAEGRHPDESNGPNRWRMTARSLAQMQIQSLGHAEALIQAGCQDLRTGALDSAIEPGLDKFAALMEKQSVTSPARLRPVDLRLIEKRLKAACRESALLEVPSTLGHSDFNAGNILVDHRQACFLDWAQAHVGSPFLTLEYLTLLIGRCNSGEADPVHEVRSEYLRPWRKFCSAAQIARLAELTPLLAVFAYAVVCLSDCLDTRDLSAGQAGYIRSLARRTLREAQTLDSLFRSRVSQGLSRRVERDQVCEPRVCGSQIQRERR